MVYAVLSSRQSGDYNLTSSCDSDMACHIDCVWFSDYFRRIQNGLPPSSCDVMTAYVHSWSVTLCDLLITLYLCLLHVSTAPFLFNANLKKTYYSCTIYFLITDCEKNVKNTAIYKNRENSETRSINWLLDEGVTRPNFDVFIFTTRCSENNIYLSLLELELTGTHAV